MHVSLFTVSSFKLFSIHLVHGCTVHFPIVWSSQGCDRGSRVRVRAGGRGEPQPEVRLGQARHLRQEGLRTGNTEPSNIYITIYIQYNTDVLGCRVGCPLILLRSETEGVWLDCREGSLVWLQRRIFGFVAGEGLWFSLQRTVFGLVAEEGLWGWLQMRLFDLVAKEGLWFGCKGRSLTLWQRRIFGLVEKEGLWFGCWGRSLV